MITSGPCEFGDEAWSSGGSSCRRGLLKGGHARFRKGELEE